MSAPNNEPYIEVAIRGQHLVGADKVDSIVHSVDGQRTSSLWRQLSRANTCSLRPPIVSMQVKGDLEDSGNGRAPDRLTVTAFRVNRDVHESFNGPYHRDGDAECVLNAGVCRNVHGEDEAVPGVRR